MPSAWWEPELRAWVFDPTTDTRATTVALKLFPHVRSEVPADILEAIEKENALGRFDVSAKWAAGYSAEQLLPTVPAAIRDRLYRYQVEDVAYALARLRTDGGAYLGWDRGLGKTLGAIAVGHGLGASRVIIVTPASSKQTVWVPEFGKWDAGRNVIDVGSSKRHRDRALAEWLTDGGVLLVHYEALRLLPVDKLRCDLVIVDEAHRLSRGGPGASVPAFYKALRKIKSQYRLLLSGSIIVNGPEDFFGALHYLFPVVYRSRWRDWNDKYLQYVNGGFGRVFVGINPATSGAMHEALAAFLCVRHKRDELPGLPERIDITLEVDLSPAQRRVYTDLAEQFISTLPDGSQLTVGTHIAQLVKLRQVASGLDLLGTDFVDSSKLDLATELVRDNLPNKTVVFAWHRATVDSLSARLSDVKHVTVHGGVPQAQRTAAVEAFQTNPDVKVIIATIKTLGESVTLHAAADLVFVESSWTAADMDQAADRVYRIGQDRRVTITHIVAKDTVDETLVLPKVTSKADMRKLLLGG